tara:strand:- start:1684 stop:1890 length:207 start_codon:yes stop_codon:yes gene_type:complete
MYNTSDIAFASFLVLNGQVIIKLEKQGRKICWYFKIPKKILEKLTVKWPSSEAYMFFSISQELRKHTK